MHFFKNGVGWCVRHDPRPKPQIIRKSQAPIFRKLQAASSEASSTKLRKHQAASIKPRVTSVKLQAGSNKLPDPGTTVHEISIRGPRTKGLYNDKGIVRMS